MVDDLTTPVGPAACASALASQVALGPLNLAAPIDGKHLISDRRVDAQVGKGSAYARVDGPLRRSRGQVARQVCAKCRSQRDHRLGRRGAAGLQQPRYGGVVDT